MADWTNGYVNKIDYTHGFYRNLTPANMVFVRQTRFQNGADLSQIKTYCELGCGQGFSTNLLAAANPHIDFYANDFNPAHVAQASNLARQAHLPNVHFFEDSFAAFAARSDLPEQFDIIALHGVYSWVGEDARAEIREFLSKKLKPSGMIYISYNALAGWGPLLPLRQMLTSFAPMDPSSKQIKQALSRMEQVLESNPGYLKSVPGSKSFFARLKERNVHYLAHELFNADFCPMPFSKVEQDMKGVKAEFVGAMDVLHHHDDLHFNIDQCHLLSDSTDQATRQDLRDFLSNEQFRRDLFIKGAREQTSFEVRQGWMDQWFAQVKQVENQPLETKTGKGRMALEHKIYKQILDCLSDGPCRFGDIAAKLEEHRYKWTLLTKAITLLVGAKYIQPCLPKAGLEARKARTDKLNRVICRQAIASNDLHHLASPILGSAVGIERYDMILMLAEAQGEDDPAHWAYQQLEWGESAYISAGPGDTPESPKLEKLRDMYARFEAERRHHYARLGIIPDGIADQGSAEYFNGNEEGSTNLPSQEVFARFSSN